MSKIEVNTVEPQCGTTLTLGGSGDTVQLGSGASQTGFGRTGTVDWITTPKVTGDSPVTAVTGKGYFLNTTAGTITINLPAGAAGSIVSMADYAGTWQTYAVTVSPNGSEKIGGVNTDVILDTEGQSVTFVYVDAVQGWINVQDSTSNERGNAFMVATGGTITTSGNDKIHTFTGPGTFTVAQTAVCAANNVVSYAVVAGGGGGGGMQGGGGGGAGGFRETKSPATPYTASPLDGYPSAPNRITVTATAFPITVGGGGAAAVSKPCSSRTCGVSGSNSQFSTIIGAGGGGGGKFNTVGINGGSGGGGGGRGSFAGGSGNTPPVTPAQGSNGGVSSPLPAPGSCGSNDRGAGGGGATAVGGNAGGAPPSASGNGGNGATTCISGTPTAYAGGGGGGKDGGSGATGTGGTGGGAAGATDCNAPGPGGAVNTGGGGGGAGTAVPGGGTAGCATAGGSGVVIIRYKFQ